MRSRLVKWTVAGLVFGLTMLIPPLFGFHLPIGIMVFVNSINAPALSFAHVWSYDWSLPPGGEIGSWMVVPFTAVAIQWMLIGLALGSRLRQNSPESAKGEMD